MPERTTQRDIARVAGVDVSTVSLALSGHRRIPAPTRARIGALAKKLGYRPDPALASIAASRWQGRRDVKGIVLAFVADNPGSAEPELKLYQQGIIRQAGELGYGVEAFSLQDYASMTAFWRVISARGIRGIVVGQSRWALPPELFSAAITPVVHCGFLREVPADMVRPDLRHAVEILLECLSERHRRVVCFLSVERLLHSDHVILGAVLAAAKLQKPGRIRVLLTPESPRSEDWSALARARPDAVLVINEKQEQLLRRRNALPAGVPVFTLHTLPPFEGKQGMDLRMEEIGRVAVNFLEMKMRMLPLSSASFRQTVLIEPRLVGA